MKISNNIYNKINPLSLVTIVMMNVLILSIGLQQLSNQNEILSVINDNTVSNREMTIESRKVLLGLNHTYSPEFAEATQNMSRQNLEMLTLLNNTFNPDYVYKTTANRESINDTLQQIKGLILKLEQNVTKEVEGSIASFPP